MVLISAPSVENDMLLIVIFSYFHTLVYHIHVCYGIKIALSYNVDRKLYYVTLWSTDHCNKGTTDSKILDETIAPGYG